MTLSIRRSLQAVLFLLALLAIGGMVASIVALRLLDNNYDQMTREHVKALTHLKKISDAYAVTIVDTTHKVGANTMTFEEGEKSVADSRAIIVESWRKYIALDEEDDNATHKRVVGEYGAMMKASDPFIDKLIETIRARQIQPVKDIAAKDLYPAIDPLTEKIDELQKIQMQEIDEHVHRGEVIKRTVYGIQLGAAAIVLALLVAGLVYVTRQLIAPLNRVRLGMVQLAGGDVDVSLPDTGMRNEIGEMARSVEAFRENELERRRIEVQSRLEREQEIKRQAGVEMIVSQFRQSITEVRATLDTEFKTMCDASGNLTGIASQAANGVVAAREAAEFSSSNLSTVRNAANELTAASREISEQVGKANDRVCMAMEAAKRTDRDISSLAELAGKVGAIVGIINTIAEQTNMLALNATIEAARAGEAGRSFAVVAAEVKTLADQTARATEEISGQIGAIQKATEQSVHSIHEISAAVAEIELQTSAIAAAVGEQEGSTMEIARSIAAASEGSERASRNVTGVTQSIDRTSQQATRLAGVSDQLGNAAAVLSRAVDSFLADITADVEARRSETRRVMRQAVLIDRNGRRIPGQLTGMDRKSLSMEVAAAPPTGAELVIELSMGERLEGILRNQTGNRIEIALESAPSEAALQRVA